MGRKATGGPARIAAPPARGATAVGLIAIGSWSALALLTVGAGPVPPFLLTALCFGVGAAVGFAAIAARGRSVRAALAQPPAIWALGVGGLFGYHALYFFALQSAPPAEAGLIAYLWPLLIVLLASLLPGGRLRAAHLAGAVLGFAGAALLILKGGGFGADPAHLAGYLAAFGCAFIWSGYSVLSRLAGDAPTDSVAGFCLAAAILAALAHLAVEATAWPQGALAWASVAALGLGPVGAAFYAWDHGVKRGDLQLLGVASYAAPLLSTLALAAAGVAEPSPRLALAAALIVGGAALAAFGSMRAKGAG
ncbi:MAG: DMT family transporter [Rubrimonas sp.]|uniref:aromatic amino acid exporter YddG n=1 Tax=Rubrimonas sp. TaxID=2036015 RepID=UPI002FDEEF4E